jgi:hypothetical protein
LPIVFEVSKLISKWVFYIEEGPCMAHFGLVYLPLLELGSDNGNGTQHTAGCGGMHAFFFMLPTVLEIMVF